MTTDKSDHDSEEALSSLPLGLLLGRISGALRVLLLEECQASGDDVRLIGLALAIESRPGSTQAEYARFLGIDLNTASRLISRAEQNALVRRVPSKADRRAHVLELTQEGKALSAEGSRAVASIETALKQDLGAARFETFRSTAEQILKDLG